MSFFSLCIYILPSLFYVMCKVELASASLWIINDTGSWWMYKSVGGSRIAQVATTVRISWLCVFNMPWEWRWVRQGLYFVCCFFHLKDSSLVKCLIMRWIMQISTLFLPGIIYFTDLPMLFPPWSKGRICGEIKQSHREGMSQPTGPGNNHICDPML